MESFTVSDCRKILTAAKLVVLALLGACSASAAKRVSLLFHSGFRRIVFTLPEINKKSTTVKNNDLSGYEKATIYWTGSLSVDGCEWTVKIDSTNKYYHPDVLNSSFMQDGLDVMIKYEITDNYFSCLVNPQALKIIHVLDIQVQ